MSTLTPRQRASDSDKWLFRTWLAAIPDKAPESVVEWAVQSVKLIGSARSESYDPDVTPWTKEPAECANNGTRKMTFIKPIQAGGSAVGEIALMFWLAHWNGGDVQYNWQNDTAADARWKKHTEKKLKACLPVMARTSPDRFQWTKGLVVFPHCNFIMQGIYTDRAVASDSIRGQVNEEIHDAEGWLPGRLEQAYGRTTAYWNSVTFNISNAGWEGDQLHQAFLAGTQQHWQVKCPGCGLYHTMRTQWDDENPKLGGLRYDADGCRLTDGTYNYAKLEPTISYQMPCEYRVRDNIMDRRALSLSGHYSEPTNKHVNLLERSYTLEAVSVDYIPWLNLIKQKHLALRARKLGNPEPWFDYLRERECKFVNRNERSSIRPVVLSTNKKDRAGMPNKEFRFAAVDRQTGRTSEGEMPHFWVLIMDFDPEKNGLIVHEGKHETESELTEVLRRHEVKPVCVFCDTSADTVFMYQMCLRNGYNGIKVAGDRTFTHEDGSRKVWGESVPLWLTANRPEPTKENPDLEPEFFLISQAGAFDRLSYLMSGERKLEIPSDVSEDFKEHFKAWSLEEHRLPATNQMELRWKKANERHPDHLWCCASYLAVVLEMVER